MSLQVGDKAPDFTLKDAQMNDVRLGDQLHHNVVLLFVPLAFTSVCTAELCEVSSGLNAYKDLDALVFGISVDSPFSLKAWADKEGISIPLLSDFNRGVSAAYGAQYDELLGFEKVAKRSAFVIDKEGVVRLAEVSEDAKVVPDFEKIKGCLASLS